MIRLHRPSVALVLALVLATPVRAQTSRTLASVPFRLHDNRLLVEVMLNGKGPFTMIFDTGAPNVMTPECRRRLGLAAGATESTSGAGEHQAEVSFARVASLELGGFTLHDQDFRVVDLGEIRRAFRFPRLDGIVGCQLLERAHVGVDFDRGRLRISQSSEDSAAIPAGAAPIELVDGSPVVAGSINGVAARLLIDTGDRSNLTVFRRFAASSRLDSLFAGRPEIPTGVGVGGLIPGRVATIPSVTIGSLAEHAIVARLPSTRAGLFASSPLSASVGTGLLKNYNFEIDYRHRYIAFTPRTGPRTKSEFVPLRLAP